jgi:hypothetical protein
MLDYLFHNCLAIAYKFLRLEHGNNVDVALNAFEGGVVDFCLGARSCD